MPTRRFQAKVRAYLYLRQSGGAVEHFKTSNFRILTVTPGMRRLAALRNSDRGGRRRPPFLVHDLRSGRPNRGPDIAHLAGSRSGGSCVCGRTRGATVVSADAMSAAS